MPPLKILVCFTCPAMMAWVTPASSKHAEQVPSCPSEIQWIAAPTPRPPALRGPETSPRCAAITVTRGPGRARPRARGTETAVAGDQAQPHDAFMPAPRYSSATAPRSAWSGRRRMTPRCERRMKSTSMRTSGAASSGSCSIRGQRRGGVQLRLQQVAVGLLAAWPIVSGVKPRRVRPMLLTPKTRAGRLPMVRANGSASLVTTE